MNFTKILLLIPLLGCNSELAISPEMLNKNSIESFDRLSAKPGEEVTLTGKNLSSDLTAKANDKELPITVKNSSEASLTIPEEIDSGLIKIDFLSKDKIVKTLPLLIGDSIGGSSKPIIPLEYICDDFIFKDDNGDILRGERNCDAQPYVECSTDGQTACIANDALPAASKDGLAAKILTGETVAGVSGTAAIRPADCASDGATGCVVLGPSYAATLLTGAAAKILTGQTLAGVSGTAAVKPADCAADGGTNCVAVAAYPAALASGAAAKILTGQTLAGINGTAGIRPSDCSTDGGTNCVAVTNFPAVDKANSLTANAASIRSSISIAGVAGTLADCSSDGGTTCVAVANFPAVDKVNNITANAAKIRDTVTIAGVAGTLADCSSDGGTTCVAVTNFPAVQKSLVTAAVLKSGTTIVGITGDYPSATYPLTGADGTADLTSATLNAKLKSATAFEWFDANGTRYTASGDTDITAANIALNVDVFGTTGSLVGGGSNCTADGQTGCVTTATYKSVDTSAITAWDIRAGKSAGGIAGSLNFYKNMSDLAVFNRTAGTGSSSSTTTADFYDAVDDYDAGSFPTNAPAGFAQNTGSAFLRDAATDDGAGGGVASNGDCESGESCVYLDRITGLYWARDDGSSRSWENGITYCEGLSYGGYTDWRMPTQKELLQTYNDGIWSLRAAARLNLSSSYYWSATTISYSTGDAWLVPLAFAGANGTGKGNGHRIICVR